MSLRFCSRSRADRYLSTSTDGRDRARTHAKLERLVSRLFSKGEKVVDEGKLERRGKKPKSKAVRESKPKAEREEGRRSLFPFFSHAAVESCIIKRV